MKKIIAIALLLALGPTAAEAFRLYFTPVTTYTDNTAIEPQYYPVLHDFWVDNTVLAVGVAASPVNLLDNTYGATHVYTGQARLSNDPLNRKSAVSPGVTLTNPLDSRLPKVPAAPWSIGN